MIDILFYISSDNDVKIVFVPKGQNRQRCLLIDRVNIPNYTCRIIFSGRNAVEAFTPVPSGQDAPPSRDGLPIPIQAAFSSGQYLIKTLISNGEQVWIKMTNE